MSVTRTIIDVALDEMERDPALRARLRAVLGTTVPAVAAVLPVHMKVAVYAEHVSLSVRTVRKLVVRGLPCVGAGRSRRVDVARADEWLRRQRQHVDAVVELEARRRARQAAARLTGDVPKK